jgi:hypothetical protein
LTASPATGLADLYARLSRALGAYDWYLFGARAAIVYGSARATVDVDLGVRLRGSIDELVQRFQAEGCAPRIDGWRALVERARVLLLLDERSGTEIDVVFTGPGLEDEFHARARATTVAGVRIPVIAPEDLVVGKILAGRSQDLQDVEAVLCAQGNSIDNDRIRSVLAMIESALARADLLPAFDQLVTRVGQ